MTKTTQYHLKEYQKQWREGKHYHVQWYQCNKARINEWQGTKVKCPCGGSYTLSNKAQHEKTRKHEKYPVEELVELMNEQEICF